MFSVTKSFNLVGDRIEVTIYDIDENLLNPIFEMLYEESLRLQKVFNFYDPESELSVLNKERKRIVSEDLLKVIKSCLRYCELTNGLYDISKGKQFDAFKKNKDIPKVSCTYKDIKVEGKEIILENGDVMIDLGSAAKGYIGDKLKEFLQKEGIVSAFIDLRGDLIFFGENEETISVQNPRDKSKFIKSFKLKDKAVATSGDYNQFHNNYDNCHILCKTNIASATAIAETLLEADIRATCLFITNNPSLVKIKNSECFLVNK